jgi:predicted  nucleic acid-binding Zn-ribbon protein
MKQFELCGGYEIKSELELKEKRLSEMRVKMKSMPKEVNRGGDPLNNLRQRLKNLSLNFFHFF